MGMTLTTFWVCERCKTELREVLGTIPTGWVALAKLNFKIDLDSLLPDVLLPDKKAMWYICNECHETFMQDFLGIEPQEEEVLPPPPPPEVSQPVTEPVQTPEEPPKSYKGWEDIMETARHPGEPSPVVGGDDRDGVDG